MKIAFLIRQLSNFRLLGPVIDRALEMGVRVECWPDYSAPTGGVKRYLFPDAGAMPRFEHGDPLVRSYDGPRDLVRRLDAGDADAVVSLTPRAKDTNGAATAGHAAWAMLQSGPDTFHYASEQLAGCDLLALHSPWWLDWGTRHRGLVERVSDLTALRARFEPRCRYVGYPEAESGQRVDREAVRRRWGIPADQPVVVLLPFPQGVGRQSFWPKNIFAEPSRARRLFNVVAHREFGYLGAAWRPENDADVARAIRAFCDRNGAFLLVKSREKTPIPEYLRQLADKCIYDEPGGFYPPTIIEALSIASFCISYYSLGILEATALGVPHVCIAFRPEDYLGKRATAAEMAFFETFFNRTPGGLFEFPSVTRTMSAGEAIAMLPHRLLTDFAIDSDAQRDYRQQFFGPTDGRSATRAVEAIVSVAATRAAGLMGR